MWVVSRTRKNSPISYFPRRLLAYSESRVIPPKPRHTSTHMRGGEHSRGGRGWGEGRGSTGIPYSAIDANLHSTFVKTCNMLDPCALSPLPTHTKIFVFTRVLPWFKENRGHVWDDTLYLLQREEGFMADLHRTEIVTDLWYDDVGFKQTLRRQCVVYTYASVLHRTNHSTLPYCNCNWYRHRYWYWYWYCTWFHIARLVSLSAFEKKKVGKTTCMRRWGDE